MYKISVITPVFNGEKSILRSINSIINQLMDYKYIEHIIVDDCSQDRTVEIVRSLQKKYNNIKLIELKNNNGNPSEPRNIGIKNANSPFIMFLDADDELTINACSDLYLEINQNNLDLARGDLFVLNQGQKCLDNSFDPSEASTSLELKKQIIKRQSSNFSSCIYSKIFLINNEIFFPNLKLGEDSIFFYKALVKSNKIKYVNVPIYNYIKDESSVTGGLFSNELLTSNIEMWKTLDIIFKKSKIDYFEIRFPNSYNYILNCLSSGVKNKISKKNFIELCKFYRRSKNKQIFSSGNQKKQEILQSLTSRNYLHFVRILKSRLLIVGHDLKFLDGLFSYFEKYYEIKIDNWNGHENHDENESFLLLDWADIIFCEWMLGNVVWYSKNKHKHQKLLVRAHKFELFQKYGDELIMDNVDRFIFIAPLYYHKFSEKFKISRNKCVYIPNYIKKDFFRYNRKNKDSRIGMIGYVPKIKRLDIAIDITEELNSLSQESYHLHLLGKEPNELTWIKCDMNEMNYFNDLFSTSHEIITKYGWGKTTDFLENIKYLLSTSDIEGSHQAVAESLAFGVPVFIVGSWEGKEYLYPKDFIFNSQKEVIEKILYLDKNPEEYYRLAILGHKFVKENYHIDIVSKQFKQLFGIA